MHGLHARTALASTALASLAACAVDRSPAAAEEIRMEERLAPVPTGRVRVVDAETGAPIAGAEVLAVREASAPIAGPIEFHATATTDVDGWAALPLSTEEAPYSWRVVRAEGYAVSGAMRVPREGMEPETVELVRAGEARVRVVDFLGRPVPDLYLGFCVGCGHTPDVASAVTDADGRATFRCVGAERDIADLYPVGDGVRTDYLYVDWDAALDGEYEAVVLPGATLRGRVESADGTPAAGHFVGAPDIHRGPWTRTEHDGSFVLRGMIPHEPIWVQVQDPDGQTVAHFGGSRYGLERRLRLPAEPSGDTRPRPDTSLSIRVRVDDDRLDELGVDLVPGQVWDPDSGWCEWFEVALDEPETLELAAGTYELELGGGGSPFPRTSLGTVELVAGADPLVVEHRLPRLRTVRLEVAGLEPGAKVQLTTASGTGGELEFDSIEDAIGVIEALPVPAEPFGLRAYGGGQDAFLELDADPRTAYVVRARPR